MSTRLVVRCVAFLVLMLTLRSLAREHQEAAPKHYFNQSYNFCIDYSSSWQKVEPFDRNAVELFPSAATNQAIPRTDTTVGGMPNQPSEKDETRRQTLDEVWDVGIEAMSEDKRYSGITTIAKNSVSFAGYPALRGSFEYSYRKLRWRQEQILFIPQSNAVFLLTLACRPEETEHLMPIFDLVARSLRLRCNSKLPERH